MWRYSVLPHRIHRSRRLMEFTEMRWISVKKRLPEEYMPVLIRTNLSIVNCNNVILTAYLEPCGYRWKSVVSNESPWERIYINDAPYWIPLSALPTFPEKE